MDYSSMKKIARQGLLRPTYFPDKTLGVGDAEVLYPMPYLQPQLIHHREKIVLTSPREDSVADFGYQNSMYIGEALEDF